MARLHALAGPADPAIARQAAPRSIRALFGSDRARNAVHVSAGMDSARRELAYVFERKYPFTAVATHCAACIIKPHALEAGHAGAIVDTILAAGLEISALRSVALTRGDANDYLDAYKGVVPEFERWVTELSSAPSLVLEVRGDAAVDQLRAIAGPYDVAVAKALEPETVRARFGVDNVRNAVHVTDVERDGPLECKFLFAVVQQ